MVTMDLLRKKRDDFRTFSLLNLLGWHRIRYPPRPPIIVNSILFLFFFPTPLVSRMWWSVSSHWSSCYGFKYDVGYSYLFYFHHGSLDLLCLLRSILFLGFSFVPEPNPNSFNLCHLIRMK